MNDPLRSGPEHTRLSIPFAEPPGSVSPVGRTYIRLLDDVLRTSGYHLSSLTTYEQHLLSTDIAAMCIGTYSVQHPDYAL